MEEKERKRQEIEAKKQYNPQFIFEKKNYTLMGIGLAVVVLGFILMAGGGSEDPEVYSPAMYSWRRIRLAPTLVLIGFGIQVYAILFNPNKDKAQK